MKKLITIVSAALLTLSLSAQTEQGTIILEGGSDLNWTSQSVSDISVDGTSMDPLPDISTSQMQFSATAGYFVIDGLAVGLLLDYSSTTTKEEDMDDVTSSSMTFGPIVRYYIGETGAWGQLSYGMGSSKSDDNDGPKVSSIGIGAGYSIWLSDNVSFSPSLGYLMRTSKQDIDLGFGDVEVIAKSGGLVFSAGIAIHLGN